MYSLATGQSSGKYGFWEMARISSHMRMPTLYIPHGAGPCFFMDFGPSTPAMWEETAAYLRSIARTLPAPPKALLIVSAHWLTPIPTINAGPTHSLYYDYFGGAPAAYQLQYAARGDSALGLRIVDLLHVAGLECEREMTRGLDHGVFIPLMLMFPDANIPVIQLSLVADQDPQTHLALGRSLAPLRDEGVLIVGSGISFHNSAVMPAGLRGEADVGSGIFDAWLTEAMTGNIGDVRAALLANWENAPMGRHSHPTPEHLLPLHVAAGAAEADRAVHTFRDSFLGATFSAFQFG